MNNMKDMIGRLALRTDREFWNAYYAGATDLEDAILLGTISLSLIVENPVRKEQFIKLMQESVSDLVEDALGVKPEWPVPPQPAPENERDVAQVDASIAKQLENSIAKNSRMIIRLEGLIDSDLTVSPSSIRRVLNDQDP